VRRQGAERPRVHHNQALPHDPYSTVDFRWLYTVRATRKGCRFSWKNRCFEQPQRLQIVP